MLFDRNELPRGEDFAGRSVRAPHRTPLEGRRKSLRAGRVLDERKTVFELRTAEEHPLALFDAHDFMFKDRCSMLVSV